jgi:hypothetical protein
MTNQTQSGPLEPATEAEAWEPEYEPEEDPKYLAYLAAEEARGPLAFAPDDAKCWECGGFNGLDGPTKKVVALAGISGGPDPWQLFKLECGHVSMGDVA